MLTPSQLSLLKSRSTSPWPSGDSFLDGIRVFYISHPNPLSGAPAGAFEIHDLGGKFLTWTDDPAIIGELARIESAGYNSVLNLFEGGAYRKEPTLHAPVMKQVTLNLEGLVL